MAELEVTPQPEAEVLKAIAVALAATTAAGAAASPWWQAGLRDLLRDELPDA